MFDDKEIRLLSIVIEQVLPKDFAAILSARSKLAATPPLELADQEKAALVPLLDGISRLDGTPAQMAEALQVIASARNKLAAPLESVAKPKNGHKKKVAES